MPLPGPFHVLPRYLNPALRSVAGYLPPVALLHLRGRSGRAYATPVQAYRTTDDISPPTSTATTRSGHRIFSLQGKAR